MLDATLAGPLGLVAEMSLLRVGVVASPLTWLPGWLAGCPILSS